MSVSVLRLTLVLGLLSCIGPFAIDMYLPAMPAIAADLGAGIPAMQTTLTVYFVAFGVAQLVYGPWADQAGRKPPLVAGVLLFIAGSLLSAVAPSAGALAAGRFVQGLGGAAVMVVPRAVIRDLHSGHEATRLMAAIMLVISVSPMLAPLAGAGVLAVADWRAIFGVLAAAGLASLALTRLALPETPPPAQRRPASLRPMLAAARLLLTHRRFLGLTFLGGLGMASFLVFIASAPFVYAQSFGLGPSGFSLAFAANALGFVTASQAAAALGRRFGAAGVVRGATAAFAGVTAALFGLALAGLADLWVTVAGLFVANAFLGLVLPTTMVMALEEQGEIAGLAASLGGTLQMLAGGAMIAAAGPFFDGSVTPMLGAIALCGALALPLAAAALRRQAPAAASAPPG